MEDGFECVAALTVIPADQGAGGGGWGAGGGQAGSGLLAAFVCQSHFTIHQPSVTVRRAFGPEDPSGAVCRPSQLRDEAPTFKFLLVS